MDIRPSDLLKPVKKVIKPYECSLIAADGPRMVGRWHMNGLQIPFDSQFTATIELQPGENSLPIMYGQLGTNITFLAIRVVYGSKMQLSTTVDPIPDKYIEYYFEDEPLVKRTITDIMILTGNDAHRIPQIYVSNPTGYIAELHILCANVKENVISTKLLPVQNIFTGLYYSSILSDRVNFTPSSTGSTQIEIYNDNNDLILVLPYVSIDVIKNEAEKLIIKTDNDEDVTLQFLSEFHAKQAHSRISWVTEDYVNRYLTSENPGIDTNPPVISFYALPVDAYTGTTVTKTQLIENFIDTIIDARDGEISKYDTVVTIRKVGSIRNFEEITEMGNYEISFTIGDIAGNTTTSVRYVAMYRSAPVITYLQTSLLNTMYINDSNYYKTEYGFNAINEDDIRNFYIDCVQDYVDTIAKSAVTVSIVQTSGSSSGLTSSGITLVGDYTVTFSVTNGGGFTTTDTKYMKVYTNNWIKPSIVFNSGYTGSTISVISGLTQNDLIDLTVSAITNLQYDTTVDLYDIDITGIDFPTLVGNYTGVTYSVTNYSGFDNSDDLDRIKEIDVI